MPKQKSNRAAAKRFRCTANGYKHKQSFRNHILTKKSAKRKRHLRTNILVDPSDVKSVTHLLINF